MRGRDMRKNSFTLVELMVVIAIVGVLSTMVMPSVSSMIAKARDTQKKSDFSGISTALYAFLNDNICMPNNYNPCCGACQGQTYYDQSMQELVSGRYLKEIPTASQGGYCYYNYGANNNIGAILVTSLETYTGPGLKGSCRPWGAGQNWCDQSSSSAYCMCNPY